MGAFRRIVLGVVLVAGFWPGTAPGKTGDMVFVQCAASQGNGFDWASTMSWLSSQIWQTAKRAQAYQRTHPEERVGVDISCYSGASSSGALTVLIANLLANPYVGGVHKGPGRKILSVEQALRASEALLFLSTSADLHPEETLGLGLAAVNSRLGGNREPKNNPLNLRPWNGAARSGQVLGHFSKWIAAARLYGPEMGAASIDRMGLMTSSGAGRWNAWDVAMANRIRMQYGLETVLDAPTFKTRQDLRLLNDRSLKAGPVNETTHLSQVMIEGMKEARNILDAELAEIDIASVQDQSLPDHFCVTVFLIAVNEQSRPPFDYDRLKLMFLCNHRTYRELISSPELKTMLDNSAVMRGRIYLGAVGTVRDALNITVREPELLPVLTGRLNDPHIGLTAASEFANGRFRNLDLSQAYLFAGGFPGPRMNSWVVTALLEMRARVLKGQGYAVDTRFANFGKIDIRDRVASFAERVVVTYFESSSENLTAEELLERFHKWQDEFCTASRVIAPGTVQQFFRMDWNVGPLPAGLADQSYILTAKGWNQLLVQSIERERGVVPKRRFRFDPIDNDYYIPSPPPGAGLPCAGSGQ